MNKIPGFHANRSLYEVRLFARSGDLPGRQPKEIRSSSLKEVFWDWVKCGAAVVGAGAACAAGGPTGVGIAGCLAAERRGNRSL